MSLEPPEFAALIRGKSVVGIPTCSSRIIRHRPSQSQFICGGIMGGLKFREVGASPICPSECDRLHNGRRHHVRTASQEFVPSSIEVRSGASNVAYPTKRHFREVEILLQWIELSAYILNARHDAKFCPLTRCWKLICKLERCPILTSPIL